ncbi:uncharacterized protein LOC126691394 [Quercus robur]|uniref:uncharacterized protein LOC126691394 n=1 Tax=Quercus robur TaxID=38942 RepID=UPI0021627FBB|nr:uncharacterized protein LOC126691394 [Quercus robur]
MEPVITVRKILQDKLVECSMKGNLHRVKMIQLAEAKIKGTILTKMSIGEMGIVHHSITLFRESLVRKAEVMGAWRLRDTEDYSSLVHLDSTKTPFKIMNILIWNCRGAMKPQFRKIVMDLVEWHAPMLMVITETRMSGARAVEMIESLPFDGSVVVDTIGFAGGIWLLWRTDLVHVEVLASTEQEIHAIIWVRSQSLSWIISAIYASPKFIERCMLWENLKLIATLHDLPWALMGDFNEVIIEGEKAGGNPIFQRRVRAILDCINECQMMDLGFSGPKFTWTYKRELGGLIQCRLDRVWANPDWKSYFPEANVTHLSRVNSDHYPLLLNLCPNLTNTSNRPFRFQPMWLSHNDFPAIFRQSWAGMEDNLVGAITRFTHKAQTWNKEIFGNIFARKRQIMARLLGAQRAIANNPNSFLINLQEQLSGEYNEILQLEEELWAMKSRQFQEVFTNSFVKLYQTNQTACPLVQRWDSEWCMRLEVDEANSVGLMPFDKEIWDALRSMKPYKALGSDGMHAGFYQRFWLVAKDSVRSEVKQIFANQKIPDYLNQTLIALIPKQLGLETVSQYRPISLCNTIYKIVSKILVQRIRPLLPRLISPMQAAFLEGRRGADNVIIAQELIYSLGKRRGKDGYMVVKIDLEKAYDCLEWSFIRMVLIHFGFPVNIIKLILSCVSTTSTSLLFNGSKLNPFVHQEELDKVIPFHPIYSFYAWNFLGLK